MEQLLDSLQLGPCWPPDSELELLRRLTNVLSIDPALYANASREFGRGFALATRLHREALLGH